MKTNQNHENQCRHDHINTLDIHASRPRQNDMCCVSSLGQAKRIGNIDKHSNSTVEWQYFQLWVSVLKESLIKQSDIFLEAKGWNFAYLCILGFRWCYKHHRCNFGHWDSSTRSRLGHRHTCMPIPYFNSANSIPHTSQSRFQMEAQLGLNTTSHIITYVI